MTHDRHRGTQAPRRGAFVSLLRMLGYHKGALIFAVLLSLIGSGLGLVQPLVVNRMITQFSQGGGLPHGLIGALIGLLIVSTAVSGLEIYIMTRTAEAAVLGSRKQLLARMLRLPIATYDTHRTGDLVSRLGSDTTLVRTAFTGGLISAIGGVATMAGAIVLMALIDIVMLLVVLGVVVAAMVAVVAASSRIQKSTKAAQKAVGDLGAGMERSLLAIRTIRAAHAEDAAEAELGDQAHRAFVHGRRIAAIEGVLYPVSGLAMQGAFLAVLGVGGMRVAAQTITVADLVSFVLYLFMVAGPLTTIFGAVTTVRSAMGAIERIDQVMEQDPEDTDGQPLQPVAQSDALAFEHVTFSYPTSEGPVLEDVTFHVPPGTRTALVGPSGSGKSTTLALIERFYDPDSGRIMLNGQDASTVARPQLRAAIGYVEQEAAVLAGTVADNLRLANPNATDEQCWQALRDVNMAERFVQEKGLETTLGDRGMTLSGGQRQRLALARMLLMDTPLLLLDEPTSAVDSHNEQLILDAVAASSRGRTTITVAHRLSTVTDSDQIIVLDGGRVAATGTHEELMATSELYRQLASRQLLS